MTEQTVRVLLVGTGTPAHRQHHQRDMYLPAIRSIPGWQVAGIWAADAEQGRAAELAADADAPLFTEQAAALAAEPHLAIVCADTDRPDDLAAVLESLTAAGIPTFLDKPTLLPTPTLADLADRFPGVAAGHIWRSHPAMVGARTRVTTGGLGLLHAVHGELLVGPTDGPHPQGELRNLAVHALDVVQSLIGDLHGRAHASIAPAGPDGTGEAITLSLRCEPDVAVTLLIGRTGAAGAVPAAGPTAGLVHRYRLLGSHGQLLVDLNSPVLDIVGAVASQVPFGPSAVAAHLQSVAGGNTQPDLSVAAGLAGVLDALAAGADSHRTATF